VLLGALAGAGEVNPDDGTGAVTLVALQYDFTVTGGTVGDMVPVLVHTHLDANVDPSGDPDNANAASASINLFGLSSVGGAVVSNGPGVDA
jgi:hypothetical protein